jgi:hypothetical protein
MFISFSGPLHGGANEAVIRMLISIGSYALAVASAKYTELIVLQSRQCPRVHRGRQEAREGPLRLRTSCLQDLGSSLLHRAQDRG